MLWGMCFECIAAVPAAFLAFAGVSPAVQNPRRSRDKFYVFHIFGTTAKSSKNGTKTVTTLQNRGPKNFDAGGYQWQFYVKKFFNVNSAWIMVFLTRVSISIFSLPEKWIGKVL